MFEQAQCSYLAVTYFVVSQKTKRGEIMKQINSRNTCHRTITFYVSAVLSAFLLTTNPGVWAQASDPVRGSSVTGGAEASPTAGGAPGGAGTSPGSAGAGGMCSCPCPCGTFGDSGSGTDSTIPVPSTKSPGTNNSPLGTERDSGSGSTTGSGGDRHQRPSETAPGGATQR